MENIIKQGTIFGPILCCGSMAEMNYIEKTKASTMLTKDDNIEALVYVDDIGAAGSRTRISELGKALRQMEREKGLRSILRRRQHMQDRRQKRRE